jgi:hypothetical protein
MSIKTRLLAGQAPPVADPVRVRRLVPHVEHPRTERFNLRPLTSHHVKRGRIQRDPPLIRGLRWSVGKDRPARTSIDLDG